jgi:glycosyltransferase involved in cell wall biosynthesis
MLEIVSASPAAALARFLPARPMPDHRQLENLRIAIVHDWLDTWRGGESALAEVLAIYPHADLYALVDFLPPELRAHLRGKHAHTSFLQRLPGAARHFRVLLPVFPRAVEALDVGAYDLVISISHAVAKGVRTRPTQLHLCYCLTPMRYAWDLRETYLDSVGALHGPVRLLADAILDRLQRWDVAASARVDGFIAISEYIRERIHRYYDRSAAVVYPPVDVDHFTPGTGQLLRQNYLTASRWVPYKRLEVMVEAFRAMPDRRLIVAGDGPELRHVRAAAGTNIEFAGEVSRDHLRDLMRDARAFVFAADEDFGIAPVEAQACGTPVIAYGRGGALETIRGLDDAQPTGVFFRDRSPAAIRTAVARFEQLADPIAASACRANAERFAATVFRDRFARHVTAALREFRQRRAAQASPC